MSIITGDVKYSASELEAIVKQDILSAGFTTQSEICVKSEPDNGIGLRDQATANVFTLYQMEVNETARKIALFSAAKDTDDQDVLNDISSLDVALKIFKDQKYSDNNLELMIPISKCNQWSKHWNFLHIIKDGNTYTAKLYEPKGMVSFQLFYSLSYIKHIIAKHFPNCEFEVEYLGQQDDDTICGVCTAENMMSKIRGKPSNGNIKEDEDEIRIKHLALYKKEYPHWQEKEQTKFVIKKEIKDQKKVSIDGDEWDVSMEGNAAKPSISVATSTVLLPDSEQDSSTKISNNCLDKNKELIVAQGQEEELDQPKILTAREYLIEIQQTIFKTKDWQTGLGGEDANFYNKKREYINSASVPFGIKEILNEIKKVQDNEKCSAEAFVKIQEIARKRLYQPRFSCCLFQVRSDLTTNFYSWVVQLDRKGTVKTKLDIEKLNPRRESELT